jgi:hypothetical protein
MMPLPFVSVVVLNYNGAHYLPTCLDSLRKQSYPGDKYEVIVSDNGSTDESRTLVESDFPWVRFQENKRNLGFASGNNVAIRRAQGEFIALLNNDTEVDPEWLENLVSVALSDPRIGIVTARIRLFYHQLDLVIKSATFRPENDARALGVMVSEVKTGYPRGITQYLGGFYGWEQFPTGKRFRWTDGQAVIGVPVSRKPADARLQLEMAAPRPGDREVEVAFYANGELLNQVRLLGTEFSQVSVRIPLAIASSSRAVLQNTGSLIFWDGSGRDRGTYVKDYEVFFEIDRGQYSEIEEVFAGCGASMLMRRHMLEEIGALDDDFFMYYEDTDLSWRARLHGYRVMYAPGAITYHIHCGTAEEWSPFFLYHVERNRLAMVFKNGSVRQFLNAWLRFYLGTARDLARVALASIRAGGTGMGPEGHVRVRVKVARTLLAWLPMLIRKRRHIQRRRKLSPSQLDHWFIRKRS